MNGMSELNRIGPDPARVTIARPLSRAVLNGGSQPVEAVAPVILDNDAALAFLRDRSRQGGPDQDNGQALQQGDRPEASGSERRTRRHLRPGDSDLRHESLNRQQSTGNSALSNASSNGFTAHLLGQSGYNQEGLSVSPSKQQIADLYSQTSEAYRRAGAEPILYAQASQVVSVAI
jgi:hypothetical protein